MGIDNTTDAVRFVVSSFLKNLKKFFVGSVDELTTDDIAINATLCMLVGITLQDTFISRIDPSESNWFDRGVFQSVFWVLLFLLTRSTLALLRAQNIDYVAVRSVFVTIPIAFLFGAYGSSLGYFLTMLLDAYAIKAAILPSFINALTQSTIILVYFSREVRAAGEVSVWKSRVVMITVFLFVLIVDGLVIWSSYWRP